MVGGAGAQHVGQRVAFHQLRQQHARTRVFAAQIGVLAQMKQILVAVGVEILKQTLLHLHRPRRIHAVQLGIALEEGGEVAVHLACVVVVQRLVAARKQRRVHLHQFCLGAVEKAGQRQQCSRVQACLLQLGAGAFRLGPAQIGQCGVVVEAGVGVGYQRGGRTRTPHAVDARLARSYVARAQFQLVVEAHESALHVAVRCLRARQRHGCGSAEHNRYY